MCCSKQIDRKFFVPRVLRLGAGVQRSRENVTITQSLSQSEGLLCLPLTNERPGIQGSGCRWSLLLTQSWRPAKLMQPGMRAQGDSGRLGRCNKHNAGRGLSYKYWAYEMKIHTLQIWVTFESIHKLIQNMWGKQNHKADNAWSFSQPSFYQIKHSTP